MSLKKGLFEEIQKTNTEYPDNTRVYPIPPSEYASALTNYITKKIGKTLDHLAETEQYEEMFRIVAELEGKIMENKANDFIKPLSSIQFRYDEEIIPLIYPELFFNTSFLVTNQNKTGQNFFKVLRTELVTADHVNFMVSFIRWSGLQLLWRSIEQIQSKKKQLNILTSTYMNVTEPKALRRLLELDNVKVKIFDSGNTSFHTKAYLFQRDSKMNSAIIGSSNLSATAIQKGYEWNVKLPDSPTMPIYRNAEQLFTELWNDERAIVLTPELIDDYEEHINQLKQVRTVSFQREVTFQNVADFREKYDKENVKLVPLQPNSMQQTALEALKETRVRGNKKGIVIAATGTGKTYLSAFDVKQSEAIRVLFLAHRDELLEGARETFISVFGTNKMMGKVTGTVKEWDKPFLFSTVQTLHREDSLSRFAPTYFDYIIVDEFHHAEAETYRKILDYFQPQFLLGITATPERMDGRDVLALCDNNVVFEIRLHQALETGLLAPFHYFGLGDTVDYSDIALQNGSFNEDALVKALKSHERVDYIIEMIEKFGYDGDKRRALGFCASIEHAKFMTDEFNRRGYTATCLTGDDATDVRRSTIKQLERKEEPLEFIFTVNIFNEGIDIPSLNLVLFLRPTESATVFIQQLGRGLRKSEEKEFVTILDFIGNYQRSFIVPLALSGQTNHKAFDRDALRVIVETEFANLPEGCFVELEEISRQEILEKIQQIRMDDNQMLTNLYNEFRRELGYSPEIEDFLYSPAAPSLHYFIEKYGSWVESKRKMKDTNSFDEEILDSTLPLEVVQRLEQTLPIKWPYEFAVLAQIAKAQTVTVSDVVTYLTERFGIEINQALHESYIVKAMKRLEEPYKKQNWSFGSFSEGRFLFDAKIADAWKTERFHSYFQARLDYGFVEFRRTYSTNSFFQGKQKVQLYQNYTRNELIYLFQSDAKEGTWREGISRVNNHYLLFVNLKKDEKVAEHLTYHDYFIDKNQFHWQSANPTSHASERGKDYMHHKERGLHIHLFVRKFDKMHGKTLPFTYVGELDYVSSVGDKPMSITWKLHHTLPDDLYLDFVR